VVPANVAAMDLTATTTDLAAAASDVVRLVPGRLTDPVLSGLLLSAGPDGVVLAANDRERAARLACSAVVHTDGRVLVPAKPLAETLRALDAPEVRLVVEGTRLAIRVPGAHYALPLLDVDIHPGAPQPPDAVGLVPTTPFASLLSTVAATASRDDALPLYTGVRIRAEQDRLILLATDRFRMAVATLPWQPVGPLDVLIPAALLTELAKQIPNARTLTLHADRNRMGFAWANTTLTTGVLDGTAIHESKVPMSDVDTHLTLDADALAAAVRRVSLYTDPRGVIAFEVGDSDIRLRSADRQAGEAEETVKSTVDGGRTGQTFQARYLIDALRPFSGQTIRVAIQPGMRAALITRATPGDADLRYIVMPMRLARHSGI
jgi:DNA polymerase III subunit beta